MMNFLATIFVLWGFCTGLFAADLAAARGELRVLVGVEGDGTAEVVRYFYSLQLDGGVPFTNCQYAANNGFLCFDGPPLKQLEPGMGFWVYRP